MALTSPPAYNFIVDGSDNFDTKFLVNDVAIRLGIAFSHAGIVRLQGQTMTVLPGKTACYRCLFQAPPPAEEILNCQQAGILGAVAGTTRHDQATEAVEVPRRLRRRVADGSAADPMTPRR